MVIWLTIYSIVSFTDGTLHLDISVLLETVGLVIAAFHHSHSSVHLNCWHVVTYYRRSPSPVCLCPSPHFSPSVWPHFLHEQWSNPDQNRSSGIFPTPSFCYCSQTLHLRSPSAPSRRVSFDFSLSFVAHMKLPPNLAACSSTIFPRVSLLFVLRQLEYSGGSYLTLKTSCLSTSQSHMLVYPHNTYTRYYSPFADRETEAKGRWHDLPKAV